MLTFTTKALFEQFIIFLKEAETFAQEQDFGTKDIKEIAIKLCNIPKQNEKRSRVVVLTQGVHPVVLAHNGKIKEFPVKVLPVDQLVDTNGAGDAFAGKRKINVVKYQKTYDNKLFVFYLGGFLSQYIQGRDLTVSIKCGMWAARQIVQRSGCTFEGKANFDPAEE